MTVKDYFKKPTTPTDPQLWRIVTLSWKTMQARLAEIVHTTNDGADMPVKELLAILGDALDENGMTPDPNDWV